MPKKKKKSESKLGDQSTAVVGSSASNVEHVLPADSIALIPPELTTGNECFNARHFAAAIGHYTKGVQLAGKDKIVLSYLFTNRAIVHLHLKEYKRAIEDANGALAMLDKQQIPVSPSTWRAHAVRGFAFALQGVSDRCLEELTHAVRLEHQPALKQLLVRASHFYTLARPLQLDPSKRAWQTDFAVLTPLPDPPPVACTCSCPCAAATVPAAAAALPVAAAPLIAATVAPPAATATASAASAPAAAAAAGGAGRRAASTVPDAFDGQPPALIPIGEASVEALLVPLLPAATVAGRPSVPAAAGAKQAAGPSAKDLAADPALREKELGNEAYSQHNYVRALHHYSQAIARQPSEAVFYSNRAMAYLKLHRFLESIADCSASLDRTPSIKAFARRAAAWSAIGEYFLAAEDYKRALKFEPSNVDCLGELEKCLVELERDYAAKLADGRHPAGHEAKLAKSLTNVRLDLSKIAAKKREAHVHSTHTAQTKESSQI
eukprot:TRINITY_DN3361_c0_g1_i2.p1 TRINITY_DN3361_c0_g1~~TRINITY_DN3361_c0_g1_i2.p1  ORF type:complete len:517 (-),score=99.50 TRINITY_DN3361_c0_g1_i2:123-1601(-)